MITVFVNERATPVPPGATALAAVRAADPDAVLALEAGRAYLTDGRGIALAPDVEVRAGDILRVVRTSRGAPRAETPPA